jgi:tripartite-type tricarboxylate transporter receptor subunit TctC
MMRVTGRNFAAAALTLVLTTTLLAAASAVDNYPDHPVTIVVPFPPGASNDLLGRFEADVLGRALHGTFVVENKPGAGGEIGISYAARADADGYTLLHAPSIITLIPFVKKEVSYDLKKDFAPVTLMGFTEFCLVVSPSLPVNSVADLIALAKAQPNALTYASVGNGSPHQIFAEQFKLATGTSIRHIPYKGSVQGLTDVASGNVSMEFVDATPALPLIQAGKLKLLAVLSKTRDPDMPDIPALAEAVPGYEAQSWQGFFAHSGTPKDIIDRLNTALVAALKTPETAKRFKDLGIIAKWNTPEEFSAFITDQSAKWGKVIHDAGIPME